jgi:hypothetical protein
MAAPCPVPARMWASDPMRLLAFAVALWPLPILAEASLTAEGFEAHVLGKTVTYARQEGVFGIEEYLPGREVRWSVAPNLCQYGSWYPEDGNICFVYLDDPTPHCWTFWLRGGALVALSADSDSGTELYEVAAHDQGLSCPGPDVGV